MISSASTLTKEKPPYKIRKFHDGWHLTKWVDFHGLHVESFIGAYREWTTSLAVMDADAGPDTYPLFKDLEAC